MILPNSTENIKRELEKVLPLDFIAMYWIDMDIEYSDRVPTISLQSLGGKTLFINKEWVEENCLDITELAWVVMFEIVKNVFSVIYLDIAQTKSTENAFVWFEVYCASIVYNIQNNPTFWTLPKRLFETKPFPAGLMVPKREFGNFLLNMVSRAIYSPLSLDITDFLEKMGKAESSIPDDKQENKPTGIGTSSVEALQDNMSEEELEEMAEKIGNAINEQIEQNKDDAIKEAVRQIAQGNYIKVNKDGQFETTKGEPEDIAAMLDDAMKEIEKNAGRGKEVVRQVIQNVKSRYKKNVKKEIEKMSEMGELDRVKKALGINLSPSGLYKSSRFNIKNNKRDAVKFALGIPMVTFTNKYESPYAGQVRIVVDVSGSQSAYIPFVIKLIKDLGDLVHEDIILFSDYAYETKWSKLKKDMTVNTSGGTTFEGVRALLQEKPFKKVVVFTDGYIIADKETMNWLEENHKKFLFVYTEGSKDFLPSAKKVYLKPRS